MYIFHIFPIFISYFLAHVFHIYFIFIAYWLLRGVGHLQLYAYIPNIDASQAPSHLLGIREAGGLPREAVSDAPAQVDVGSIIEERAISELAHRALSEPSRSASSGSQHTATQGEVAHLLFNGISDNLAVIDCCPRSQL